MGIKVQSFIACPGFKTAVGGALAILGEGVDGLPTLGVGEAMEVVSSDLNDASGDTGARTCRLVYLDTASELQVENITLNGTVAVATTSTAICRVVDFWCTSYGSSGTNEGNITIRVAGGGANRLTILAGHKRGYPGIYTVPAGYNFTFLEASVVNENITDAFTPGGARAMFEATVDPESLAIPVSGDFSAIAPLRVTGPTKLMELTPRNFRNLRFPPLSAVRLRVSSSAVGVTFAGCIYGVLSRSGSLPVVPIGS